MRSSRPPSSESILESWQAEAVVAGLVAFVAFAIVAFVRGKLTKDHLGYPIIFILFGALWLFALNMLALGLTFLSSLTRDLGLDLRVLASFVMGNHFYVGTLVILEIGLVIRLLRQETESKVEAKSDIKAEAHKVSVDLSILTAEEWRYVQEYPRFYVRGDKDITDTAKTSGNHLSTGLPPIEVESYCTEIIPKYARLKEVWIGSHMDFSLQFPNGQDFLSHDRNPSSETEWATNREGKHFIFRDSVKVFEGDVERSVEFGTTPTREALARLVRLVLNSSVADRLATWEKESFPNRKRN